MSSKKSFNNVSIGERVEQVREYFHLQKKEFAEKLDIHPNSYTNYIDGTRQFPTDVLLKITEMYDVSLQWIMTGEGTMLISGSTVFEPTAVYEGKIGLSDVDIELLKKLFTIPEARVIIYKFISENIHLSELAIEYDKLLKEKISIKKKSEGKDE